MRKVVLLRVGVDAGSGGIQGPLFEDGSFDFVCIPDSKGVGEQTYGGRNGKNGKPLTQYFRESRRKILADQTIHLDPEFESFTYGDPTPPKRSLRKLIAGDLLVFYCGLQRWDEANGWDSTHRPALYLAGFFEVACAGLATDFDEPTLNREFTNNFHVRYPSVFAEQKERLVLVKGGPGSRLFQRAHQISDMGLDRSGNPLKVLSKEMQGVFGDFNGRLSIQRSPPRWVAPAFAELAAQYVMDLE